MNDEQLASGAPWFAGKSVDTYLYRINRRPMEANAPMVFPKYAESLIEHVFAVLEKSGSIVYERRNRAREWKVGNLDVAPGNEWVSGRLGSTRENATVGHVFNQETKEWTDVPVSQEQTVLTPFALLSDMRVLAVAAHPDISETVAPRVFARLLNSGERRLSVPTTHWAVEPILDDRGFEEWIQEIDRVTKVKFVFKRPNPDGLEDIQEMMDRLLALKAESISEEVKASDSQVGLDKHALSHDPFMRKLRSAAVKSWAQVTARGYDRNTLVRYKQKTSVARTTIDSASATWDDFAGQVVSAAKRGKRKVYDRPTT